VVRIRSGSLEYLSELKVLFDLLSRFDEGVDDVVDQLKGHVSSSAKSESRSSHRAGRSHDNSGEVTVFKEPLMHLDGLNSISEYDGNNAGGSISNKEIVFLKLLSHVVGVGLTLHGYFGLLHTDVEGFDGSSGVVCR
jgi:hypothetical protein